MAKARKKTEAGTTNLGFEAPLWAAADAMRGNLESAEYKHVVLGLLFLKYVSDAFEERHGQLIEEQKTDKGVDPEDADEYTQKNIFYIPPTARWPHLKDNAKSPDIGKTVDEAMKAIEDADRTGQLRGVLPRDYSRPALDKTRLGQVIDLLSNVGVGGTEHRSKDTLGRVYEYFLGMFASAEGRRGGEFYTPGCVVRLLVEMLQPRPNSRVYDPCCGSGGMFVQSEKFIEAHGGTRKQVAVYGQEMNHTTWRLCRMNLAIRGIEGKIEEGDTFKADKHPDLRADYVLANPPFNMSDWGGDARREDVRWSGYTAPPVGNANYAWILHFVHHLAPNGVAGFVMANGSMAAVGGATDFLLRCGPKDTKTRFVKEAADLYRAYALAAPADAALAVVLEVGFVQAVRAALVKTDPPTGNCRVRTAADLDAAVQQLVSRALVSDQVVDIFAVAGMKRPDVSVLSEDFLRDVQGMRHTSLAAELLERLLRDEISTGTRHNVVRARQFSEALDEAIHKYQNRSIEAAQVIEEMLELARQIRDAHRRGDDLHLTPEELAFYDSLEVNDSAVSVLGTPVLCEIARELVKAIRSSVTIDWEHKESVRAEIRTRVKRLLRRYGYPPDKQDAAVDTVLKQATELCKDWAAA